jgi:hypothetical protein
MRMRFLWLVPVHAGTYPVLHGYYVSSVANGIYVCNIVCVLTCKKGKLTRGFHLEQQTQDIMGDEAVRTRYRSKEQLHTGTWYENLSLESHTCRINELINTAHST